MSDAEALDPERTPESAPPESIPVRFWNHPAARATAALLLVFFIVFQYFVTKPEDSLRVLTAHIDTFNEDLSSLQRELPEVRKQLRDFGTFYESGAAARRGLNPYAEYQLSFFVETRFFHGFNPNLNPPVSLLVFAPLSMIEPGLAFQITWWLSLSLFVATMIVLSSTRQESPSKWMILWAACFPGFWDTLDLGQIYILLLVCSVAAWILLERERPVSAGLMMGILVAMKPNFLVWPVVLFIAGYRRTALAALAGAAILSILPAVIFGPGVYVQWLDAWMTSDPGRILFGTNLSLAAMSARAGVLWIGVALGFLMLAGIALWAWRFQPRSEDASAVALVATVLASPIGWIHYVLFLLPIFLSFRWNSAMKLGGAVLAMPVLFHFALVGLLYRLMEVIGAEDSRASHFFFASLYGWAFLILAAGFLSRYWPQFRAIPSVWRIDGWRAVR